VQATPHAGVATAWFVFIVGGLVSHARKLLALLLMLLLLLLSLFLF
jgi:hypothetical protein